MSGGGSGNQTSTTTQTANLPTWEQAAARDYLGSLMNYVFPTSSQPANDTAAASMLNQIDPTGTAYSMFSPMISGSPYLQQMAQNNPAAVVGAISPAASSQLGNTNLYGSGQSALSWIPGYTGGLGTSTSAAGAAPAAATAPAANSGSSGSFGGIFSPSYAGTAATPPATPNQGTPATTTPAGSTGTLQALSGGPAVNPAGAQYTSVNNPLANSILAPWFTQQSPQMQQQIINNLGTSQTQTGRGGAG